MKILIVNYVMNIGGIEQFLMNLYRNIDHKKIEFVFLCYEEGENYYKEEIINSGGKFYKISSMKEVGFKKFVGKIKEIILLEKIDVVHINTDIHSFPVLFAAYISKVKNRIVHAHTTRKARNLKEKIKWMLLKILVNIFSTKRIACSKDAGKTLFFFDYEIVPNGIVMNNFKYDSEIRIELRNKYNLKKDDIVLGHVGRFDEVKNHIFMIELIKNLIKINQKYKLVFVGDGQMSNPIKKIVNENSLEKYVIFVGKTEFANIYYNMFDLFVFPSLFEGLGITLIEAQANGLLSLASEKVPKEVDETGNIRFLPLNVDIWLDEIIKCDFERFNVDKFIGYSRFNITNTVNIMEKIYMTKKR